MTGSDTGVEYHPWTTYINAREEARRRGDRRVGSEHLILGLLYDADVESVLGVTLESARATLDRLDEDALRSVGIAQPLQAPSVPMRPTPSRPTVKAVLAHRLPLTPAAKLALQEAGRPMRRGRHITPRQVLRALLDLRSPDPGASLLAALGVDAAAVRRRLDTT